MDSAGLPSDASSDRASVWLPDFATRTATLFWCLLAGFRYTKYACSPKPEAEVRGSLSSLKLFSVDSHASHDWGPE